MSDIRTARRLREGSSGRVRPVRPPLQGEKCAATASYILKYQGREYHAKLGSDNDGEPLEVITMAMQMLFYKIDGEDFMKALVKRDPEMLDLALGALFRYDPS